jgi:hypothetical protein
VNKERSSPVADMPANNVVTTSGMRRSRARGGMVRSTLRTVERDSRNEFFAIDSLLSPIHEAANTAEAEGFWSIDLNLFGSPGFFRVFLTCQAVSDHALFVF